MEDITQEIRNWKLKISAFFLAFLLSNTVFAASNDSVIDSTYKYAYGENIGWLNFGTTEGNVHVTDTALTGYVWGENVGWISLNCSNTSFCGTVDYKVRFMPVKERQTLLEVAEVGAMAS